MADTPPEVADRLFAAVEAGDIEALRHLYHPDASVWHSYDGISQTVEENLATLSWIARHAKLRYDNVRRHELAGGLVEQHDTVVSVPDRDEPVVMPACLVILVDGGRVTRIDEYIDSAAVAELLAAIR